MLRRNRKTGLVGLLVLLAGLSRSAPALAAPLPEQLLPATTREFYASPSPKQLLDGFRGTSFGKLLSDPLLAKFTRDMRTQIEKGGGIEFLGFTANDLLHLDPGESAWATVAVGPRQKAEVLLLDVSGKHKLLDEVLAERSRRWKEAGGSVRTESRAGQTVTIQERTGGVNNLPELRIHSLKDNLLVVCSSTQLLDGILERWDGGKGHSLADLPAFQSIQARTKPQKQEQPQFRFFIDPFGLHALNREPEQGKKTDLGEQLKKCGLGGFKALGGFVSFTCPSSDVLYRVAIFAPKPHHKAMGLFQMLESTEQAPPAWVCAPCRPTRPSTSISPGG